MNQCSQCGVNLPPDAKFCLQCGAPVPQPVTNAAETAKLDFVQPALTGGMFLGLLSSIPFISAGNCLCCIWVLGGGGLAAFMLTKQRPGVTYGDGAFAGVLSGLFGAIVATLISIPVRIIASRTFEAQRAALEETFRDVPEFQGALREFILQMSSPENTVATVAFTLFMNVVIFSLFAMIGGILTVGFLKRR